MCSLRQDYELLKFKVADDYSTPHTFLDLTSIHGRRKRDEEMNEEEPQAKIVKCEFHNSPVTGISVPPAFGDALIGGSQGNTTANGLCTGDEKKRTPNDADEEMEDIE